MSLFRERFSSTGLFENEVYPGVPAMLEEVRDAGFTAYVATSKPLVYAERILEHFGLDRYFKGIYGADLGGRLDDKADLLAEILTAESLSPLQTAMIGDRATDIVAARKNGLRSIGVLWGYGSVNELLDAGATALSTGPAEVVPMLEAMSSRSDESNDGHSAGLKG